MKIEEKKLKLEGVHSNLEQQNLYNLMQKNQYLEQKMIEIEEFVD
jgi:hypothetical protein